MGKQIIILIACTDDGIAKTWDFEADTALEVAAHICGDKWRFLEIFQQLNITSHYDHSWEFMDAATFLGHIYRSRMDGDSVWGFYVHEIDLATVEKVAPALPVLG